MPKKETTAADVYSWCYYGYKAFQCGRLACGDVTALAESIAEAAAQQIGEEAAEQIASSLAEQVWDTYDSCKDFKEACKEVSQRKCSICRNVGHNRRTCNGWLLENMGLGH